MDKCGNLREATVRDVINGRLRRRDAAEILGVSLRTVHSYVKKYMNEGQEGLIDHRRGHFQKLNPEQEIRIVACKTERPYRSARWIRDWLKLPVSPEAVRQILLKHRMKADGTLNATLQQTSTVDSDEEITHRITGSRTRSGEVEKTKPAKK
jgi:transposase